MDSIHFGHTHQCGRECVAGTQWRQAKFDFPVRWAEKAVGGEQEPPRPQLELRTIMLNSSL